MPFKGRLKTAVSCSPSPALRGGSDCCQFYGFRLPDAVLRTAVGFGNPAYGFQTAFSVYPRAWLRHTPYFIPCVISHIDNQMQSSVYQYRVTNITETPIMDVYYYEANTEKA